MPLILKRGTEVGIDNYKRKWYNASMSNFEASPKVEKLFFAGTTIPHQLMPRLYGNIIRDETSNIPVSDRLIALPVNGLVSLDRTIRIMKNRVEDLRGANPDSKFILAGHSQGGVIANELGLAGLADAVVSYAAPDRGVDYQKDSVLTRGLLLGARALSTVAHRNIPLVPAMRDMASDSDFTREHIHRMQTEWPAHIPRFAVAAHHDGIVPLHSVLSATPDSIDWMVAPKHASVPESVNLFPEKSTDHISVTMTRAARTLMEMMELELSQAPQAVA